VFVLLLVFFLLLSLARLGRLCWLLLQHSCGCRVPGARSKAAEEPATGVNSEGLACPNQPCASCGMSDADLHALGGDGTPGRAERIQTFRSQGCRTTLSPRGDTPS
jgi:hypothetical protein